MKKQLALILVLSLFLSLTACGGAKNETAPGSTPDPTVVPTEAPTEPSDAPTEPEATESPLDIKMKGYPEALADLGNFRSPEELTAYRVFCWCQKNVKPINTEDIWDAATSTQRIVKTYSVASLDAKTKLYFGRTWAYDEIIKTDLFDDAQYHYDGAADTVVVTYLGASGGPSEDSEYTYKGYTALDDTHYEIVYSQKYFAKTLDVTIVVEKVGENYLVCSQDMYEKTFREYPSLISVDEMCALGFFDSVEELSASRVFQWAMWLVEPAESTQGPLSYTYRVSELHDFTTQYLGRMYDYAQVQKDNGSEKITYDADAQTVTVTFAGGMGGMNFDTAYVGYERVDNTCFVITYETNYDAYPDYDYSFKTVKITVELADGDFVIVSHQKA